MWAFRHLPVVARAVRLRLAAWNTGILPRPTFGRRRRIGADEPILAHPGDAHGLPDLECCRPEHPTRRLASAGAARPADRQQHGKKLADHGLALAPPVSVMSSRRFS